MYRNSEPSNLSAPGLWRIKSSGIAFPRAAISNNEYLQQLRRTSHAVNPELNSDWIYRRTGVQLRGYVSGSETLLSLAQQASLRALQKAQVSAQDLQWIGVSNSLAAPQMPSLSSKLAHELGASTSLPFDFSMGFSSFLIGLHTLRATHLPTLLPYPGPPKNHLALLTATEVLSPHLSPDQFKASILFGDGAGAWLLEQPLQDTQEGFIDSWIEHYPEEARLLEFASSNTGITMRGTELFKTSVEKLTQLTLNILERNGLTPEQLDLCFCHQGNRRIVEALSRKLHIPLEKWPSNIQHRGNTGAATLPTLWHEWQEQHPTATPRYSLFLTFGAGTWAGAALYRKE